MTLPFVSVFDDGGSLADECALQFADAAREAIEERGLFRVALAGGTTPARLYRHLVVEPFVSVIRWASVHVFWGDERCVPECSADRNDLVAREAFIDLVPLPPENVHPIQASLVDGASRYEETLRAAFGMAGDGVPRFDLVLLGIGPDGHTASLFPGHVALAEEKRLAVRVVGAPKPPPERITLTLPVLNAARAVTFLVTGAEKAEAVRRAIAGDPAVPAGLVRPRDGRLSFFLDPEAAARI